MATVTSAPQSVVLVVDCRHKVMSQCQAQSDSTLCLQSTNHFRVLCGPVQPASQTLVALSMVTNIVPQTAKLSFAGSEARKVTNPRALSGVKPALKSCATSSDP